jgi:hypothetical protein
MNITPVLPRRFAGAILPCRALVVFLFLGVTAAPERSFAQSWEAMAASKLQVRQDLEAVTRGCFERGWGQQTSYSTMTFSEAVPRSNEFAALHRERARDLSLCARAAARALTQYRLAVADVKAHFVMRLKDTKKARVISEALDMSADSFDEFIQNTFPKLIRLENRLSQFFAVLHQIRPSTSTSVLDFPHDIVQLETEVAHAMRLQTSAAVGHLEAIHTIFPSPALRTRVTVAKILDVLMRATVEVMSADEKALPRAFKQATDAFTRAQAIAQSEAKATDVQRMRGVVTGYIEIVGQLDSALLGFREMLREIDESTDELTPGEAAVKRHRLERLGLQMEAALDRVEKLAIRIDDEATECMKRRC